MSAPMVNDYAPHVIEEAPTEETRYGLYTFDGHNQPLKRLAETSKDGIGTALVALAEDRAEAGLSATEVVGVFDRVERRWISGCWAKRS